MAVNILHGGYTTTKIKSYDTSVHTFENLCKLLSEIFTTE
jgi:hypothetical protein